MCAVQTFLAIITIRDINLFYLLLKFKVLLDEKEDTNLHVCVSTSIDLSSLAVVHKGSDL